MPSWSCAFVLLRYLPSLEAVRRCHCWSGSHVTIARLTYSVENCFLIQSFCTNSIPRTRRTWLCYWAQVEMELNRLVCQCSIDILFSSAQIHKHMKKNNNWCLHKWQHDVIRCYPHFEVCWKWWSDCQLTNLYDPLPWVVDRLNQLSHCFACRSDSLLICHRPMHLQ